MTKPPQSLPWASLPVTQQDWTDLLPSLSTLFWPSSHRIIHILPNSSNTADQPAGLLCQCRSQRCGTASPGALLPRCLIMQTLSQAWQAAPVLYLVTQPGMAAALVSAFRAAWATDSSSRVVLPTSWQSADTRSHLPLRHSTQRSPKYLTSSAIPMCLAVLLHILQQPFQAFSPKLLWCLGGFLEQQVTKGSFSFLVKPHVTTEVALGPAELCQPQELLCPSGINHYLLPQPF